MIKTSSGSGLFKNVFHVILREIGFRYDACTPRFYLMSKLIAINSFYIVLEENLRVRKNVLRMSAVDLKLGI